MRTWLVAFLAALAFGLLPWVEPAYADTFFVDDPRDAPDRNPGNRVCSAFLVGFTQCTLRAAIMEANARPGADTINVTPLSMRTFCP